MSAKNTAIELATVVISKNRGKTTRPQLPSSFLNKAPDDFTTLLNSYKDLLEYVDQIVIKLNLIEQKLNNMVVDPGTKAMTYPDT